MESLHANAAAGGYKSQSSMEGEMKQVRLGYIAVSAKRGQLS